MDGANSLGGCSREEVTERSRSGGILHRGLTRMRVGAFTLALLGCCAVLAIRVNLLLQENRAIKLENDGLQARVLMQQRETSWQMERRLALIRGDQAQESNAEAEAEAPE